MPKYYYKAKRGPHKIVEGETVADNPDQVVVKLDQLGLSPVSIVEKDADTGRSPDAQAGQPPKTAVRNRKIRAKDIDAFTWQLASLVKASVPILRALTLIAQQTDNASFQVIVEDLKQHVKDGKTLSESMGHYPKIFNNLFLTNNTASQFIINLFFTFLQLVENFLSNLF